MLPSSVEPVVSLSHELTREFLIHHHVCPLRAEDDGSLVVGLCPEGCEEAVGEVGLAYGRPARSEAMSRSELERAMERLTANAEHSLRFGSNGESDAESGDDDLGTDTREFANLNRPGIVGDSALGSPAPVLIGTHDVEDCSPDPKKVYFRLITATPGPEGRETIDAFVKQGSDSRAMVQPRKPRFG